MRVLVIDKADIYRMGLVSLLKGMSTFTEVIELEDDTQLIDLTNKFDDIGLVLLNPEFSEFSDISSVSSMCRLMPRAKIILISDQGEVSHEDISCIDRAAPINSLKKMIGTELVKRRSTAEKIDVSCIDAALRTTKNRMFQGLSRRRLQVLELIADGHSNRDISKLLDLKEGTVRAHAHAVLKKLGVESRTQAALMYRQDAA